MSRAILLALLAAGCVQNQEPPLLALGPRACDAQPVFEAAVPVPFDSARGADARLGAEGRCIRPSGAGATTYAAFRLPDAPQPYTLNITSLVNGAALVSPRATLYDAALRPVRVLGPDEFRPVVTGLRAGVRLRGAERWLVAEADGAKLGSPVLLRLGALADDAPSTLAAGMMGDAAVAAAPVIIYIPPPTLPDIVRANSATYSLNGIVNVSALPVATVP